jgi:hypothetical protein
MADVLRTLARHVRRGTFSSVVDTAFTPYARNFSCEAWRNFLGEARPNRSRGSPLHTFIEYSSVSNNLIPAPKVLSP